MKLFGIFACCLVFATAHAKTTTLRYKAVPGDSLTYHVVKTDSASVMGQDQCGTFTADVGMKVETANNSQFTYTGTFHTVQCESNTADDGLAGYHNHNFGTCGQAGALIDSSDREI